MSEQQWFDGRLTINGIDLTDKVRSIKIHMGQRPDPSWAAGIRWNDLVAPRLTHCIDNASQAAFDARVRLSDVIKPKDYYR